MRVTISNEFTPSPQDMIEEFWESTAERQAEILYSLALICKYDLYSFCMQMSYVSNELDELDKDAREDILFCLKEMVNQIER